MFLDELFGTQTTITTEIDPQIDEVVGLLRKTDPTSEDFQKLTMRLVYLTKAQANMVQVEKERRPEPIVNQQILNTIVNGCFLIGGILLTKHLESDGPITSKSWSLLPRGRV